MSASKHWLSFEEARKKARGLGLRSVKQYEAWAREHGRDNGMPVSPQKMYDEFENYPDFLGYDAQVRKKSTDSQKAKSFAEARQYMHQIGLSSQRDFFKWSKQHRPAFIPSNPRQFYLKQKTWTSWDDFLGYKKSYREFDEAREYARLLGIQKRSEWLEFTKSREFPSDLPIWPGRAYGDSGWIGWSDFLGVYNRWNRKSIPAFLESLKPVIEQLDELELYLILSRNGMLKRESRLFGSQILRQLTRLRTANDIDERKTELSQLLTQAQDENEGVDESSNDSVTSDEIPAEVDFQDVHEPEQSQLRFLKSIDDLRMVDRAVESKVLDDEDIIELMVQKRVTALWETFMHGDTVYNLAELRSANGERYFDEIRRTFIREFEAANSLPLPEGYSFRLPTGEIAKPNQMQRLTAYKLLKEKRLGNWSGVGSGKTKASVLTAGMLNAKLTVVVAANSTMDGWEQQIKDVFSEERVSVFIKQIRQFQPEEGKLNFLIINYESFQQTWSEESVAELTGKHQIDFIVLDEVQMTRQRYSNNKRKSKRRQNIEALVAEAVSRNPELRILAMSATPVVNNLREAVKTLELVMPEEDFSQLNVGSSTANAIAVNLQLRKYGIRHMPKYDLQLDRKLIRLEGSQVLDELLEVPPGNVLKLEQVLFGVKLPWICENIRRGTLVFTHYVQDIVGPLTTAIKSTGLKVRHFTGDVRSSVKECVEAFRSGDADVLIGSSPVGTGVDGLQYVMNRIVFVTLPWSNAEYQQIIGRLWRQGSSFDEIEVIIPQVFLHEDRRGAWSWDDQRLSCIDYKRTLADAAVDGVIPQGGLPSKEELQRRSLKALENWKQKISEL